MTDTTPRLRPAQVTDGPFLCEMVREADRWRLPPEAPRPPLDEILADEHVRRYVDGWGRPGDGGVIAEVGGAPAGACWWRLFTAARHGWGFVAADVPELSLAVGPAWRRRGIGTRLLTAAIEQARAEGHPTVSLSVMADNPARGLYERAGFRRVATDEGSWTMVRESPDERRGD
ncbi:MAG TPA: GNAT family N-acetyltransferase [Thermoleophilia bacterium]|nr:GNAT family N-acetyltransferase [Thermoleophilia bacterium]